MSEDDKMKEIIGRIKSRRTELGISYQELADRTGLSKSTLQRYETGYIKNMPIDKLDDLAKALQTTPSYLMGWTQNIERSVFYTPPIIVNDKIRILDMDGVHDYPIRVLNSDNKQFKLDLYDDFSDYDTCLYEKLDAFSVLPKDYKDSDVSKLIYTNAICEARKQKASSEEETITFVFPPGPEFSIAGQGEYSQTVEISLLQQKLLHANIVLYFEALCQVLPLDVLDCCYEQLQTFVTQHLLTEDVNRALNTIAKSKKSKLNYFSKFEALNQDVEEDIAAEELVVQTFFQDVDSAKEFLRANCSVAAFNATSSDEEIIFIANAIYSHKQK